MRPTSAIVGSLSEGESLHPLFEFGEGSRLEPGQSPFRVRGVAYCRMLEDANALPGGITAFRKGLAEGNASGFFAQSFRWMEWYDALPLNAGTLVLARMTGVAPEMMARIGGEMAARHLVPRMFRVLLGLSGIRGAVQHISWVLPWFYDFGNARVLSATDDSTSVLLSDVPKIVAATYVNTVLGFMAATADLIGRTPATVEYADVTMTGERDGFARLSMRCTVIQSPQRQRSQPPSRKVEKPASIKPDDGGE